MFKNLKSSLVTYYLKLNIIGKDCPKTINVKNSNTKCMYAYTNIANISTSMYITLLAL